MADTDAKNGNGSIPVSILDRFLKLAQENNESYGSMVSAVDKLSLNVMELSERIAGMESIIETEQLAEVVENFQQAHKEELKKVSATLEQMKSCIGDPKFNILSSIAESLVFKRASEQDVQAISKSAVWFMDMVTFVRKRIILVAFLVGLSLAFILGSSGLTAWDAIKVFFGK